MANSTTQTFERRSSSKVILKMFRSLIQDSIRGWEFDNSAVAVDSGGSDRHFDHTIPSIQAWRSPRVSRLYGESKARAESRKLRSQHRCKHRCNKAKSYSTTCAQRLMANQMWTGAKQGLSGKSQTRICRIGCSPVSALRDRPIFRTVFKILTRLVFPRPHPPTLKS